MAKSAPTNGKSPSALIDERIASFDDWRGATLATLRSIITGADKGVFEEWKWGGPVWSCQGIVCTGETYKSAVKLTFPKGASLKDPSRLFNSSLEGNVRRAIDVREGETIDAKALMALVQQAVALNGTMATPAAKTSKTAKTAKNAARTAAKAPKPAATSRPPRTRRR